MNKRIYRFFALVLGLFPVAVLDATVEVSITSWVKYSSATGTSAGHKLYISYSYNITKTPVPYESVILYFVINGIQTPAPIKSFGSDSGVESSGSTANMYNCSVNIPGVPDPFVDPVTGERVLEDWWPNSVKIRVVKRAVDGTVTEQADYDALAGDPNWPGPLAEGVQELKWAGVQNDYSDDRTFAVFQLDSSGMPTDVYFGPQVLQPGQSMDFSLLIGEDMSGNSYAVLPINWATPYNLNGAPSEMSMKDYFNASTGETWDLQPYWSGGIADTSYGYTVLDYGDGSGVTLNKMEEMVTVWGTPFIPDSGGGSSAPISEKLPDADFADKEELQGDDPLTQAQLADVMEESSQSILDGMQKGFGTLSDQLSGLREVLGEDEGQDDVGSIDESGINQALADAVDDTDNTLEEFAEGEQMVPTSDMSSKLGPELGLTHYPTSGLPMLHKLLKTSILGCTIAFLFAI